MVLRLKSPLELLSLQRLRQIELAWKSGLVDRPAVLSIMVTGIPDGSGQVMGGVNAFVRGTEDLRVGAPMVARLRERGEFSEPFLQYFRELRFALNLFSFSEGEIFFAGTPIFQIRARLIDCLIFEEAARACIGLGTRALGRSLRCMEQASGLNLIYEPSEDASEDIVELTARGCRVAGWQGSLSQIAQSLGGLGLVDESEFDDRISLGADATPEVVLQIAQRPDGHKRTLFEVHHWQTLETLVTHSQSNGDFWAGLVLDPMNLVMGDMEGGIRWVSRLCDLSGEASVFPLPEGLEPGEGPLQVVRVFEADGRSQEDLVLTTDEPLPEGGRPLLERYTDRGRTCRPLPEPPRSAALHQRALEELGDGILFGRAAHTHSVSWSLAAKKNTTEPTHGQ